jgi:hypothetical protein
MGNAGGETASSVTSQGFCSIVSWLVCSPPSYEVACA